MSEKDGPSFNRRLREATKKKDAAELAQLTAEMLVGSARRGFTRGDAVQFRMALARLTRRELLVVRRPQAAQLAQIDRAIERKTKRNG